MTVRKFRLLSLGEITRHSLVFRISDPSVGSRLTSPHPLWEVPSPLPFFRIESIRWKALQQQFIARGRAWIAERLIPTITGLPIGRDDNRIPDHTQIDSISEPTLFDDGLRYADGSRVPHPDQLNLHNYIAITTGQKPGGGPEGPTPLQISRIPELSPSLSM